MATKVLCALILWVWTRD